LSIAQSIFLGQTEATIDADNGVFGDPCGGTFKRMYIQVTYSSTLPLTLVSFSAQASGRNEIRLNWTSAHEINTSHFEIERSTTGSKFTSVGNVAANGGNNDHYIFTDLVQDNPVYFYRLKMVDQDGKFTYSKIVRINTDITETKLSVFPNPADDYITISSNQKQQAIITDISGRQIKNINLVNGSQLVNIADLNPGMYILRTSDGAVKFIRK